MNKYKTLRDFNETIGVMPLLKSVTTAVPIYWSFTLFTIFILGTASSYFMVLKMTGKKRFWHSLTAMSFTTMVMSLLIASMNTAETIYLNGYWIGFYIMMVVVSYFMLSNYK